jgi:HNH endonuclease/NUMOD1 domain
VNGNQEHHQISIYPACGINRNGDVIYLNTECSIAPTRNQHNLLVVKVPSKLHRYHEPSVAWLLLFVYKPPKEMWWINYASVGYHDGNKDNLDLDNLDWQYRNYIPPESSPLKEKPIIIPGYFDYEIYKNGIILDRTKSESISIYNSGGYKCITLRRSGTQKRDKIGLHRVLALAFLAHPLDVSDLVVNHINGIKNDNRLENLEWCSYTDNINHAYKIGLRSQNIPILAMNVETRAIQKFYSLGEFCRYLNTDQGTIWNRLKYQRPMRPFMGYYVKYEYDDREWPSINEVFPRNTSDSTPVVVKNLHTGEIMYYDSCSKAASGMGCKHSSSILNQVHKEAIEPFRGYLIKSIDDDREWPIIDIIPDRQLSDARPIIIKNVKTGEIFEFSSASKAALEVKCNSRQIPFYAKKEPPVLLNDFIIRYNSSDFKWPEENTIAKPYTQNQPTSKQIIAEHVDTKEIIKFPSIHYAARYFKRDPKVISRRVNGKATSLFNGYSFKYDVSHVGAS